MRARMVILLAVLLLVPAFTAVAEDKNWEAEVGITAYMPSVLGNTAKFNEYRDLKNGAVSPFGDAKFKYDDQKGYYLNFKAQDPGYDTQSYGLDGGKWGSFKYNLFYNEIVHNITFGARSFYDGVPNDVLSFVPGPASGNINSQPSANRNVGTWNYDDFGTKRQQVGAGLKFDMLKPFYFSANFMNEEKKGTKPLGIASGTSGGPGPAIELAQPISYYTNDLKVEAGYGKNPFFANLSYYYQQFTNANEFLKFRDPFAGTTTGTVLDRYTLPPDNTFQKLSFDGNVKLPWSSVFNMKLAWGEAKSDGRLLTGPFSHLDATTGTPAFGYENITSTHQTFHGKVNTYNYDFVLTSRPWSFVDGKIFYKYHERKNKSDEVTQTETELAGTPPALVTFVNDNLFSYTKQSWGADLDWRLMKGLNFLTGYQHLYVTREGREDLPKNWDDTYNFELRYKALSWLTLRAGYEYMLRAADHEPPTAAELAANPDSAVENFVRRFDAAAQKRDTYKISASFTPLEDLGFNLGYKFIKKDYRDTILGITEDKRDVFNFDVDYTFKKWARFYGYFDYETVKTDQFQRNFANLGPANPYDPVQNAANFNWTATQKNDTFDWGILFDFFLIPKKLTLRLQTDFLSSNGLADFTYLTSAALTGGRTNDNIDIAAWDDYRTDRYMIKLFYAMTPKLSMVAGYAYERYRATDAQYNGYQYIVPATGTPTTFLTGAYNRPSYSANIYFLGATYKF